MAAVSSAVPSAALITPSKDTRNKIVPPTLRHPRSEGHEATCQKEEGEEEKLRDQMEQLMTTIIDLQEKLQV